MVAFLNVPGYRNVCEIFHTHKKRLYPAKVSGIVPGGPRVTATSAVSTPCGSCVATRPQARRRFVLTRLSREAGRPVDQMTTVLDLTGLGVRHLSKEAVSYTRRIGDIFQDNYSGMTCSLLVVNAPWVFSKGWQIIEGEKKNRLKPSRAEYGVLDSLSVLPARVLCWLLFADLCASRVLCFRGLLEATRTSTAVLWRRAQPA